MKMTVKKKSLLVRVTAIALALGVAAMLLSGAILYGIFHERASANMEKMLNKQISFLLYPLMRPVYDLPGGLSVLIYNIQIFHPFPSLPEAAF